MPWLARFDARAAQWPLFIRWGYLSLKWCLILLGAFLVLGTYLDRFGIWHY